MSNIKTSDPNMNLKPVELTPSELESVAGGNLWAEFASFLEMQQRARKVDSEYLKTGI
jgi:hypothetical protein